MASASRQLDPIVIVTSLGAVSAEDLINSKQYIIKSSWSRFRGLHIELTNPNTHPHAPATAGISLIRPRL